MKTRRRCSVKVALILLGSIPLAGCDQEPQTRHVYKSLRDCTGEWGIEKCEPATGGHPAGYYYGPNFRGSTYSGAQVGSVHPGSRAVGTVSRGGFGASAASHGGGS